VGRREILYELEGSLGLLRELYWKVLEYWLWAQENMIRGYLLDAHKMIMLALDTLDKIAVERAEIQARLDAADTGVNIAVLDFNDEKIKSNIILQLVVLHRQPPPGAKSEYAEAGKELLDALYDAVGKVNEAWARVNTLAGEAETDEG